MRTTKYITRRVASTPGFTLLEFLVTVVSVVLVLGAASIVWSVGVMLVDTFLPILSWILLIAILLYILRPRKDK